MENKLYYFIDNKLIINVNDNYFLNYGFNNNILNDYSPIYIPNASKEFVLDFNFIYIPKEANTIIISNKNNEIIEFININSYKLNTSKILYSFAAISDIHMEDENNLIKHIENFKNALIDINKQHLDFIFTCGDNTNHGKVENYNLLKKITKENLNENIKIYYTFGNHDIDYGKDDNYQKQLFKNLIDNKTTYYYFKKDNYVFVSLASDYKGGQGLLSNTQFEWLKNTLLENKDATKIFIFYHHPLKDSVSGSLYSINPTIQYWFSNDSERLYKLIKEYNNIILFTGHTHFQLSSYKPIIIHHDNNCFINCSSISYLWNDEDKYVIGSECYYVDIYKDYVVLKGRDLQTKKYISSSMYYIKNVAK